MLARFDGFMMGIGRWLAFLLALASIYVAGPFPLLDEGLRFVVYDSNGYETALNSL